MQKQYIVLLNNSFDMFQNKNMTFVPILQSIFKVLYKKHNFSSNWQKPITNCAFTRSRNCDIDLGSSACFFHQLIRFGVIIEWRRVDQSPTGSLHRCKRLTLWWEKCEEFEYKGIRIQCRNAKKYIFTLVDWRRSPTRPIEPRTVSVAAIDTNRCSTALLFDVDDDDDEDDVDVALNKILCDQSNNKMNIIILVY